MQREIKFRAWSVRDKRTVYLADTMTSSTYLQANNHSWGVFEPDKEDYNYIASFNSNWGDILMQYTGLKDKNGKKIYEGDILRCTNHNQFYWIIGFENGCFVGRQSNCNDYWIELHRIFKHNELEVVGNIYENPELLTQSPTA